MFTRRLATFLLGIWIGCCLFLDAFSLQRSQVVSQVIDNPAVENARAAVTKLGVETARPLLQHTVNEQVRGVAGSWEVLQALLGGIILMLLIFTDQRKPLAIAMCAFMLVTVAIQRFFVTPELNYTGRELDFMSENASFALATRQWTLTQMYGGLEILKLLMGGALASYFFAMESVVKRGRSKSQSRSRGEAVDAPLKLS